MTVKAPRAGFEPATNRLTVDRSTAELPRNGLEELTAHTCLRASGSIDFLSVMPSTHFPTWPFSILAAPSA